MARHTWTPTNGRSAITVSATDGCLSASRPWDLGEAIEEILRLSAEPARIRRELLAILDSWTEGAHPSSLRAAVDRDLRAALDRIAPEEG